MAGLLILGIVVRLLMGVMMRAASDSVLAVGILHQIFDANNNNGGRVDSLLAGADAGNMTQLAAAVLTVLIAAWLLWRRPGASAERQIPLPDSPLARLGKILDLQRCDRSLRRRDHRHQRPVGGGGQLHNPGESDLAG
jgi:hypothetical protein